MAKDRKRRMLKPMWKRGLPFCHDDERVCVRCYALHTSTIHASFIGSEGGCLVVLMLSFSNLVV